MLSVKEPRRLWVPGTENAPAAPVFLVRCSTLDQRAIFEAELAGPPWNAARVHDFQLVDELKEAVNAWADPDDLPRLLEVLELRRRAQPLDEGGAALLAALEEAATRNWPGYGALMQRRHNRTVLAPHLALRRFLCGWENVDAPFETDRHGYPTDSTLEVMTEFERLLIGRLILGGLYVSADEGNGSRSPSKSPAGRGTSRAAAGQRTAGRGGKSLAASGPKTRQ